MRIDGDEFKISPEVWAVFEGWYGDKAYRHADFVEEIEAKVRENVSKDVAARGQELREDDEWPISREERDCYDDAARIATEGVQGATD
jgi:hypothetical protein